MASAVQKLEGCSLETYTFIRLPNGSCLHLNLSAMHWGVGRWWPGRRMVPILTAVSRGACDSSMHQYLVILFSRYVLRYYFL